MKKQNMKKAFGLRFAIIVLCVIAMTAAILFSLFRIKAINGDNLSEADLNSIINVTAFVALLLMSVTLVACINIYSYIKRQIGLPILHITETAKRLADGQLNLDFTTDSNNEIGELGLMLNSSVKDISNYVVDIDRAMAEFSGGNFNVVPSQPFIGDFKNIETSIALFIINMSKTMKTIAQASEQVSCGAEQISGGAQSLAQGATEQASQVVELSGTINDISLQVRDTSSSFKEINKIMGVTCDSVKDGSLKIVGMTRAMDDIIKFSKKISNIVKTIDDITFQTNILALNAAVEAARAGAAGKGFAVVADEVRNLAQKSASAAKDIAELIESSIKIMNDGAALTQESAEVFRNIVAMSAEITAKISNASNAAEKEASEIGKIVLGIDQISSIVHTNSATSEESAAASEELNGQAQLLKELVLKFTLFDMA